MQKWLYSGKKGCLRAKAVEIRQRGCDRAKMVVFGKNWLHSGKSGFIP